MRGLAGTILATAALAVPSPTPAQNAAATGAPTREELTRPFPAGDPAAPADASRLTVAGGIDRPACPLAEAGIAATGATLKTVRFDDLRGLDAAALRPAYASYLGQPIEGAKLCLIRDAAAAILRRAGYVAAVQVPAQHVGGGDVRFQIVMGRLVGLKLTGGARPGARLAAYLAKLTAEPVFNEKQAERYLLLARDLPGYDIHLTLRPAGGAPGDLIGEVAIARTRLIVGASLQNYGSHEVGRWGALLSAQADGVFGTSDRLTLGLYNSLDLREQTVAQSAYDIRLGGEGATLEGRFIYAWTRPDIGGGDPLRSHTLVASLEAGFPLRRTQARTLHGAVGFDLVDQDLRVAGTRLRRDRLRAAFARLDVEALDRASVDGQAGYSAALPRWRLIASLEARRGLGLLGASEDCGAAPDYAACAGTVGLSRVQADPTATLLRFTGSAEFRPNARIALVASPRLQYAFDPLLSYEQYSGGGYTIGRGYDPGAIIGDSGAGTSLELQYGRLAPHTRAGFAFQPYAFLDAAWVWNRRSVQPEDDPLRLFSAGGGLRVAWGDRARLDLSAAVPLRRAPSQSVRGDTRVLLSLTTRLAR